MGDEIRLIRRQNGSEEAQILEFTEFLKRGIVAVDLDRKRRVVSKNAEENKLIFGRGTIKLMAFQKHRTRGIAAHQKLLIPDSDKAAVGAGQRIGQPVCVFAQFAAPVDKRAGKHILILYAHPDSVIP